MSRSPAEESNSGYGEGTRTGDFSSVKWNGISLAGRQLIVIAFSMLLARLVGPGDYGVVAQATVYITLTTLLLDQGISAALIARRQVDDQLLGAAVTVNAALALVMGGLTLLFAGPVAAFMNTPDLEAVLVVLGAALILKSSQVVPRMLLMRRFRFKRLALAETGSALVGGVVGAVWAVKSPDYWAIVAQIVATDLCLMIMLVWLARSPWPGLALGRLRDIFGFSSRVLVADLLSFSTRNVDTILVAKFLGSVQAGHYSLAYRILLMPVQMVGQTVTRVVFPIIARDRDAPDRVSRMLLRASGTIALATFPAMALVAVSARDAILVFLGSAWLPAAPIVMVLALTGARQSVTTLNAPTMLGFGRADIQVRFTALAAVLQVGGMAGGLPWGALGVAVGYTVGGVLMMPAIVHIQRRLAGTPVRSQLGVMLAPLHGAAWAAATYGVLLLLPIAPGLRLTGGSLLAGVVYVAVLRVFHRERLSQALRDGRSLVGRAQPS